MTSSSTADRLIAAGLAGAVLAGTVSAILLGKAGRLHGSEWTNLAAMRHPSALTAGVAFGALALGLGTLSLGALAIRARHSTMFLTAGVVLLALAALGGFALVALDTGLLHAGRGLTSFPQGNAYILDWEGKHLLAWTVFILGGAAALISIGIGIGKARPRLRHAGGALAFAGLLVPPLAKIGGPLLGIALLWIAFELVRSPQPAPEESSSSAPAAPAPL